VTLPAPSAATANGQKVYGRLDCPVALSLIRRGRFKVEYRVFFADAETATACGYRPCGACLREEYRKRRPCRGVGRSMLQNRAK
jgi:methylphosphotriester-DNA--protein-cysteine methyltransferase